MADNFIGGYGSTTQSDYEKKICTDAVSRLNELASARVNLNNQCEEVAALILPSHRGTFVYGSEPVPYDKKTDQQIDSNGMLALSRFMAICDSLMTPQNMTWMDLAADDDEVKKDRASRLWLFNANRKLFKLRYSPLSNFVGQNQAVWRSLGAFGNGILFNEAYYDPYRHRPGFRYTAIPFGDIYLEYNQQGQPDGFIRLIRYTAQQAFKVWGEKVTAITALKQALDQGSTKKYVFIQRVCPRDDYNPKRIDYKGMFWASYYIFRDEKVLMAEGGYRSFPISVSQYQNAPGEDDARALAMDVLPALKTLNAEKKVFLKQGHRAADPILLLADDGIVNMNMKPGAQNKGGMSADGKRLVDVLPAGNIQISEEMMAEEKGLIADAFLVALFQIMTEKNGMTATEVIERINEKGILIAPSLSRQQNYIAGFVERELDLAMQWGILPPMPPVLQEARGEYTIRFSSPLAKASRAQEAAGFFRTLEGVKEIVNVTQDPSYLDPFDFDVATPEIADIQGVPEPWMASPEKIAAKRKARADAQKIQQQIQAAPAAAAIMKAQAASAKAGVASPNIGPARSDISNAELPPDMGG